MAVIYSYPVKSTPELTDKMLISDGTDNLTKQVTISGVKDTIDVVDSLAATLPIEVSASSGAVTVSSRAYAGAATTGYVPTGGSNTTFLRGDGAWATPSGSGGPGTGTQYNLPIWSTTSTLGDSLINQNAGATVVNIGTSIASFSTVAGTGSVFATRLSVNGYSTFGGKLQLNSADGGTSVTLQGPPNSGTTYDLQLPNAVGTANQVLKLPATPGSTNQLVWGDATGGGVSTFTNTNGTFISAGTENSTATGAVTMGTIDLSATGTASNTTFLRGDNTWATPTGSGGISFSGTTANGIATYSNSTTANVSSVFTVSGNKLSAPAGSLADPSIEVGAIGGLYAASGGIFLAHSGASAIGVNSSSIVNYKLTQFNAGLKFGVSGSTLSTYTEATWTSGPTLTFSFGGAATLSASAGSYRVIGDMVFAQFQFTFSSGGYGTADLSLPVSGVAGTGSINFAKMNSSLGNSTVSTPVTGDILTNAASIRLQSFNYDQDSGSHVSGQLFELAATSGQPVFQSGDVVSGTIIYRKS